MRQGGVSWRRRWRENIKIRNRLITPPSSRPFRYAPFFAQTIARRERKRTKCGTFVLGADRGLDRNSLV